MKKYKLYLLLISALLFFFASCVKENGNDIGRKEYPNQPNEICFEIDTIWEGVIQVPF